MGWLRIIRSILAWLALASLMLILAGWWRSERYYDRWSSFVNKSEGNTSTSLERVVFSVPGKLAIYRTRQETIRPADTVVAVKRGFWSPELPDVPTIITTERVDANRRDLLLFREPLTKKLGIEFAEKSRTIPARPPSMSGGSFRQQLVLIPFRELASVPTLVLAVSITWAAWKRRRDEGRWILRMVRQEAAALTVGICCVAFVGGAYLWGSGWWRNYALTWRRESTVGAPKAYSERALYWNRGWIYGGVATVPRRGWPMWEYVQAVEISAKPSPAGELAPEVAIPMSNSTILMAGFRLYVTPVNGSIRTANGTGTIDRGMLVPPWASIAFVLMMGILGPGLLTRRGAKVLRLRRRQRAGQCLVCGYDMRGLTGVCPECGVSAVDATERT